MTNLTQHVLGLGQKKKTKNPNQNHPKPLRVHDCLGCGRVAASIRPGQALQAGMLLLPAQHPPNPVPLLCLHLSRMPWALEQLPHPRAPATASHQHQQDKQRGTIACSQTCLGHWQPGTGGLSAAKTLADGGSPISCVLRSQRPPPAEHGSARRPGDRGLQSSARSRANPGINEIYESERAKETVFS